MLLSKPPLEAIELEIQATERARIDASYELQRLKGRDFSRVLTFLLSVAATSVTTVVAATLIVGVSIQPSLYLVVGGSAGASAGVLVAAIWYRGRGSVEDQKQLEGTVRALDFLSPSEQPAHLGRLGHYEVTEVVGQGGMGVVLKAHDQKLQRVVAIKLLAPHLAASATARRRFVREAQAAAAVRNEHVIDIHAVEGAGERPYLVMEYVSGVSLQQRLDRTGPLEVEEILRADADHRYLHCLRDALSEPGRNTFEQHDIGARGFECQRVIDHLARRFLLAPLYSKSAGLVDRLRP